VKTKTNIIIFAIILSLFSLCEIPKIRHNLIEKITSLEIPFTSYNRTQIGEMTAWGIPLTPCAWCGTSNINDNIQVHHKIPQAECKRIGRLDLIHDTNNMICLCRKDGKGCHYYIGHHAKGWAYVFTNVDAVIEEGKK